MRILSVDIGWRHMAFAHLIFNPDLDLQEWEIIDILKDETINVNDTTTDILIAKSASALGCLVDRWAEWKPDIAFLETQPLGQMARNVKTKILSHIMQALLLAKGILVQFVSPKKKLKSMDMVGTYSDNKKHAVEMTLKLLESHNLPLWLDKFKSLKGKRDDLADAFLQGYYAGKSALVVKGPKIKKERVKRKRDAHSDTLKSLIAHNGDL